jgi:hypothetical protein
MVNVKGKFAGLEGVEMEGVAGGSGCRLLFFRKLRLADPAGWTGSCYFRPVIHGPHLMQLHVFKKINRMEKYSLHRFCEFSMTGLRFLPAGPADTARAPLTSGTPLCAIPTLSGRAFPAGAPADAPPRSPRLRGFSETGRSGSPARSRGRTGPRPGPRPR